VNLKKKVAQAKTESDNLKTKLRELLQEQKSAFPDSSSTDSASTEVISNKDLVDSNTNVESIDLKNNEKDALKIEMAQIKAQGKKLKAALTALENLADSTQVSQQEAEQETRQELEILLGENQKKLTAIVEKMTSLNSTANKSE
jgi:hypothetical protein